MIPVSVIVVTKNEAANIGRCLAALDDFAEVVVVDSGSADGTAALAAAAGARVIPYEWDGRYPKKRQWCLDRLALRHDWVFFVDADEVVTGALVRELADLFRQPPPYAGYFIRGRYVVQGKMLRFGLKNNKLCLFDRRRVHFPVVDDLDLAGMGEIEGHYQPVLKRPGSGDVIGQLAGAVLHYAYDGDWEGRHRRYALWERAMNRRDAWPADATALRRVLKKLFRRLPGRPAAAFLHSYVLRLGFLDGATGLKLARDRFRYYRMIVRRRLDVASV